MENHTATRRPARRLRSAAAIAAMVAIFGLGGCASMANGGFGQQTQTTQLQPYQTSYSPFYSAYNPNRISTATVNTSTTTVGASGYAGWNGDISTPGLTAAHPTLPVGSYIRVTNLETGRHAVVQVNSVLPPNSGRDVSLSRDAAAAIGALQSGLAPVLIQPSTAPQTVRRTPPPASSNLTVVQNGRVIQRTTPPANGGFAQYDPRLATASLPFENPPSPARINIDGARYLQIGSYRNIANAQAALTRVTNQGLGQGGYGQARLEPAVVDGVTYHRVRIGPMASADIAAQALSDARRLGHSGARILAP